MTTKAPLIGALIAILVTATILLTPTTPVTAAANPESAPGSPQVRLETSHGTITLELDQDRAPNTVANFLQYVDNGHYQETIFHRVIPGFMIQGGGFGVDYQQRDTLDPIANEADNGLLNLPGTIAMARTMDPHSATAQFFINTANNRFLNHTRKSQRGWGYTVFGRVIDGMEVVARIENEQTGAGGPFGKDVPLNRVTILSATRVAP